MFTDNRALQLSGQVTSTEFIDRCLHHLSNQNCREFINDSAADLRLVWLAITGDEIAYTNYVIACTLMFCYGNFGQSFEHEHEIAQAIHLAGELKATAGISLQISEHPFTLAVKVFASLAALKHQDDIPTLSALP